MYSQPETILSQYDFTVNGITKGRGVYICDTSQGMKVLTPFCGSKERAAFLEEILLYLNGQGLMAEKITRTKEGGVVATDEAGGSYLVKDMFSGPECSTKNPAEMAAASEALARLHVALEDCTVRLPEFMESGGGSLLNLYEKHYRELVKVKNYVKTRKRKNEFEMKFQKEYPHFIGQAEQSVELLNGCTGAGQTRICHGDFNQHNVVHTADGWRIINYEKISANLLSSDLSNFLRKMLEKNNWDEALGFQIIEAYCRVRAIDRDGYRQLYILLLFPEKFWKIANHYYNSHKAWLSGREIEKLDHTMEQEGSRERFLEKLFSTVA